MLKFVEHKIKENSKEIKKIKNLEDIRLEIEFDIKNLKQYLKELKKCKSTIIQQEGIRNLYIYLISFIDFFLGEIIIYRILKIILEEKKSGENIDFLKVKLSSLGNIAKHVRDESSEDKIIFEIIKILVGTLEKNSYQNLDHIKKCLLYILSKKQIKEIFNEIEKKYVSYESEYKGILLRRNKIVHMFDKAFFKKDAERESIEIEISFNEMNRNIEFFEFIVSIIYKKIESIELEENE